MARATNSRKAAHKSSAVVSADTKAPAVTTNGHSKVTPNTSPASDTSKPSRKRPAPTDEEPAEHTSKKVKVFTKGKAEIKLSLKCPDVVGGLVLAVGTGDIGQLGLGPDVEEKTRVALVPGLPDNIVQVAAGGLHSVCVDSEGKVHTWGCNDEGALGRATSCEEDNFSSGCVEGIEGKVVAVTAGDCHCIALTEEGGVWGWGTFRDNSGTLGFLAKGNLQKTPVKLPVPAVTQVGSGNNHVAMLSAEGQLYTCGCGEAGQLGRLAERFASRDGVRNRNGFDALLLPAAVKTRKTKKFDAVWAGGENTFARCGQTGTVWACGLNNYHQMGVPDTDTHFQPTHISALDDTETKQITAGQHHGLVLTATGEVLAMGRHDYGRLGLGEAVAADATVPTAVLGLGGAVSVAAAGSVSVAVCEDGSVRGFGLGSCNQLSQPDEEDCLIPTAFTGKQLGGRRVVGASVGGQHSLVLAVPV